MKTHKEILCFFGAYLRGQGKEESTIRLYVTEMEGVLSSLQVHQLHQLREVTAENLQSYRNGLFGRGMKTSTINKHMSIVHSFFRWLEKNGWANADVADGLRVEDPEKHEKADIRWLTAQEECRLMQIVASGKPSGSRLRNEALISLMLYSGLRVEELTWLRLDSVQGARLRVYDDTAVSRVVPLEDRALVPLIKWLRHRQGMGKSRHRESPYLFVTERSGFMQARAIQFVAESLSVKAGFPVTCRVLRHTYCRRLAVEGASIERIRDWAGHKSMLTTIQYFKDLQAERE